MTERHTDFDRWLIDWADEFIQDLVASFSATRPTMALRVAVAALYLSAALHLVWAGMLPFYGGAVEHLIDPGGSTLSASQLTAFTTGIIVGRVSYHLLLAVTFVLLSFLVRAARRWTRVTATLLLLVNFAGSLNGLRAPSVSVVLLTMNWATLVLSVAIVVLLWTRPVVLGTPETARRRSPKQRLSNGPA
ncbi:MAG TPA: hypothetical protein VLV86_15600 [Vicinamibacterales bacterium]|nr:hypothetical protein [Vicinamibacterales bacterium]